ncbi:hypothetical protein GCM10010520_54420 [Rhizobium viscosum]
MFFDTILANIGDWLPRMLTSLRTTLVLTVGAFCLAFMLALLLEYLRSRRLRAARLAARLYIALARGVPILVILYLIYFALPGAGMTLSSQLSAVIGLALVYAAYLAEVFRAGLDAVPAGQREAALSSGLTPIQTFRLILLPQAVRHTIAPLVINLVSLLKDSSIAALIAVPELTLVSREIMSESFLPLQVFTLTAVLYFLLAWPASLVARAIEQRLRYPSARTSSSKSLNQLKEAQASA